MGSVAIFKGAFAKILKDQIDIRGKTHVRTGLADPRTTPVDAPKGSLYMHYGVTGGTLYIKTDDGSSTNWMSMGGMGGITTDDGTEAAPGYGFASDPGTGMYLKAPGSVFWSSQGVDAGGFDDDTAWVFGATGFTGNHAFNGSISATKHIKVGSSTDNAGDAGAGALRWNNPLKRIDVSDGVKWQSIAYTPELIDLTFTGFRSWKDSGTYYTISGTTFTINRGGDGYIKSSLVEWVGNQSITLYDDATTFAYIDSNGVLQRTNAPSAALYENGIVLFECWYDATNNVKVPVRENHPVDFETKISTFLHRNAGVVISGTGANIATIGSGMGLDPDDRRIKIVGSSEFEDHGLVENIPDSAGAAITFRFIYRDSGGKWRVHSTGTSIPMVYNPAGTPVALSNVGPGSVGLWTLYVSKSDLNTSTPVYFAVMNDGSFLNDNEALNAIGNGEYVTPSNEIANLELAKLGFAVIQNNNDGGYIEHSVPSKDTFNTRNLAAGGSLNEHGALNGLLDDTHPQYLHTSRGFAQTISDLLQMTNGATINLLGVGAPHSTTTVNQLLPLKVIGGSSLGVEIARFSDNAVSPSLNFSKSRSNTIGTNVINQDGDAMFDLAAWSANGTVYNAILGIIGYIDGVTAVGDLPSRLSFHTTSPGSATRTERMRITSSGTVMTGYAANGLAVSTISPAKFLAGSGFYNDLSTAASGVVAHGAMSSFLSAQLRAANASVTYTNMSTLYVGGAPTAGTNITIVNPWSIYVDGGISRVKASDNLETTYPWQIQNTSNTQIAQFGAYGMNATAVGYTFRAAGDDIIDYTGNDITLKKELFVEAAQTFTGVSKWVSVPHQFYPLGTGTRKQILHNVAAIDISSSAQAGSYLIRLPVAITSSSQNTFVRMIIKGFDYSQQRVTELVVSGYIRSDANLWAAYSVHNKGESGRITQVRLGEDATGKPVIILGVDATVISYPTFTITEFEATWAGSTIIDFSSGWSFTGPHLDTYYASEGIDIEFTVDVKNRLPMETDALNRINFLAGSPGALAIAGVSNVLRIGGGTSGGSLDDSSQNAILSWNATNINLNKNTIINVTSGFNLELRKSGTPSLQFTGSTTDNSFQWDILGDTHRLLTGTSLGVTALSITKAGKIDIGPASFSGQHKLNGNLETAGGGTFEYVAGPTTTTQIGGLHAAYTIRNVTGVNAYNILLTGIKINSAGGLVPSNNTTSGNIFWLSPTSSGSGVALAFQTILTNAHNAGDTGLLTRVFAITQAGEMVAGYAPGTTASTIEHTLYAKRVTIGRISQGAAVAPTTFGLESTYLRIGHLDWTANSYRLIGLGYADGTFQPSYLGYQEISASGKTYGDLIFATRNVTTDTAPTIRMRVRATGNVHFDNPISINQQAGPLQSRFIKGLAFYSSDTPSPVGTIKIAMPFSWNSTMLRVVIKGYNYQSNGHWECVVSGYNYSSGSWNSPGVQITGQAPFESVRVAHDGTVCCILLGTMSTTWSYPKIYVEEVMVGYSNGPSNEWANPWTISLLANETGITAAVTPNHMMNVRGYARIVSPALGSGTTGNATFDCTTQHIFHKNGSGTITLTGLAEGQTVNVLVTNNGSAYSWTNTIKWGTTAPTPVYTSGLKDVYTFIMLNGTIYGAAILGSS